MNIIERAGKRLGLNPGKSLVEKAAERLEGGEAKAAESAAAFQGEARLARAAAGAAMRVAVNAPAGARRETRRQITIDFDRLREQG